LKTIIHIVGNRPQFIKLAILHKEISSTSNLSQKIIHTGQHSGHEMSDIFFSELQIPKVDVQLQLMYDGNADKFIAQASTLLQQYFVSNPGSIVFTYGDTNSTLAAAIAARRSSVPLFHFEAGIRTGDDSMPEEINRIITDRIASTNYCCTAKNYATMMSEGYGSTIENRLQLTGDLMYDAFLKTSFADKNPVTEKNYVLATIHRASNILDKSNLTTIIKHLNKIHEEIPVVMPLHPHTRKRMIEYGLQGNFMFLAPVGYIVMKTMLSNCTYVITDSGGVSREAFFCKKRSMIIMEKPFWPEIIEAGCSINSPTEAKQLQEAFFRLSFLNSDFDKPLFGNGNAAKLIQEDLMKFATG
jgi:UDP-GlcNAc3NAcA epimerase